MGCVILKEGIEGMFNNKTILITGGTGSFGHKFATRLLAEYNPKKMRGPIWPNARHVFRNVYDFRNYFWELQVSISALSKNKSFEN